MSNSLWGYLVGGLFSLGFLGALLGLLFLSTDKTAVVAIIAITAGGLVLIAALPHLAEFSIGLKGVTGKLARVEEKVDEQQKLINNLVATSMSESAFRHLAGITLLREYNYLQNSTVLDFVKREFYYLKDRGFIGPATFEFGEWLNETNIAGQVVPTEIGRLYLKLRKDDVPKAWLSDPNLRTDVARTLGLELPKTG